MSKLIIFILYTLIATKIIYLKILNILTIQKLLIISFLFYFKIIKKQSLILLINIKE